MAGSLNHETLKASANCKPFGLEKAQEVQVNDKERSLVIEKTPAPNLGQCELSSAVLVKGILNSLTAVQLLFTIHNDRRPRPTTNTVKM